MIGCQNTRLELLVGVSLLLLLPPRSRSSSRLAVGSILAADPSFQHSVVPNLTTQRLRIVSISLASTGLVASVLVTTSSPSSPPPSCFGRPSILSFRASSFRGHRQVSRRGSHIPTRSAGSFFHFLLPIRYVGFSAQSASSKLLPSTSLPRPSAGCRRTFTRTCHIKAATAVVNLDSAGSTASASIRRRAQCKVTSSASQAVKGCALVSGFRRSLVHRTAHRQS